MTKKDYIKIAECLKKLAPKLTSSHMKYAILLFTDMLKQDNEKFNENKFIEYIFKKD